MKNLDKVTNIAVLVASVVVVGSNLYPRFANRRVSSVAQNFMGKPLPLSGALPTGKNGTVALFVSKSCHFCSDSMVFYRRLSEIRSSSCDIKVVAIGPKNRETPAEIQQYVSDHGLRVDGADVADFPSLGVSGTPTLVLQDTSRAVKAVWTGFLAEDRQKEVVEKVTSFCKS